MAMNRSPWVPLLLALSALSFGQARRLPDPDDAEPIIRVNSRLVTLDVSVTDRRTGGRVDGLTANEFEVKDEGKAQKITHFSAAEAAAPLALYLVLDIAPYKIKEDMLAIRDGLAPALAKLRPEDEAGLLYTWVGGFGSFQALTKDRKKILDAFSTAEDKTAQAKAERGNVEQGSNGAALGRTFRLGIREASTAMPQARATFVVVTDDVTGGSRELMNQIAHFLEQQQATIYGLIKVSSNFSRTLRAMPIPCTPSVICKVVSYFAPLTGGREVNVMGSDYGAALEDVIGDITGRYELGFVPDEKLLDGKLHKITVTVKPKDRAKAKAIEVRYRREYNASR